MQYPKPLLHYCVLMHLHLVLDSVTVSAHLYYLVGGSAEDVIHLHSLRFNGTKTNCRIAHILVIINWWSIPVSCLINVCFRATICCLLLRFKFADEMFSAVLWDKICFLAIEVQTVFLSSNNLNSLMFCRRWHAVLPGMSAYLLNVFLTFLISQSKSTCWYSISFSFSISSFLRKNSSFLMSLAKSSRYMSINVWFILLLCSCGSVGTSAFVRSQSSACIRCLRVFPCIRPSADFALFVFPFAFLAFSSSSFRNWLKISQLD